MVRSSKTASLYRGRLTVDTAEADCRSSVRDLRGFGEMIWGVQVAAGGSQATPRVG